MSCRKGGGMPNNGEKSSSWFTILIWSSTIQRGVVGEHKMPKLYHALYEAFLYQDDNFHILYCYILQKKLYVHSDIWEGLPRIELFTAIDHNICTCAFLSCFSNCKTWKIDVSHFLFITNSRWQICCLFP